MIFQRNSHLECKTGILCCRACIIFYAQDMENEGKAVFFMYEREAEFVGVLP